MALAISLLRFGFDGEYEMNKQKNRHFFAGSACFSNWS